MRIDLKTPSLNRYAQVSGLAISDGRYLFWLTVNLDGKEMFAV